MTSNTPIAVIVLAAGKGTRMKSSTPKLLHEVAGRSMLKTLLDTTKNLNPQKTIVVIGPDMEAVASAAAPAEIAIQKSQDGTGGAVKAAAPLLNGFKGNVLILLGDAPLIKTETLNTLIQAKTNHDASILGCNVEDASGYGRIVLNTDGTLDCIVEHKDANENQRKITLFNTGAFCVDGQKLHGWLNQLDQNNAQNEFYITQLPEIINAENGAVSVAVTTDQSEVQGANTKSQLAELEATMQNRLRMAAMDKGVTLIDPQSVYFSYDTKIEHDVVIEPHVFFGKGVSISAGTRIKAFSYFEDTQIGQNTNIGPFARLRPGANIGDGARVGNFVEIKKSDIGAGSKIGHLAYVGDCEMGKNVNFSAGAITVNYDGYDKHKTIIGDGTMVGSNVNLVAPVTIGAGAYIAAGSTITKDVNADALSVSRGKQAQKDGWAKSYRAKKES